MIRTRLGTHATRPVCTWCAEGRAYNVRSPRGPRLSDGPLLSKEEFGLDLWEAINVNSARLWCVRHQRADEAKALEGALQDLLSRITDPDDVRRILMMQ